MTLETITLVLHWLTWIMITVAAFMSNFLEHVVNFQYCCRLLYGLIVFYLLTRWFTEKRSQEDEWGPMPARIAFLLIIEILLQKEELVYFVLIDAFSYDLLLLFFAANKIYDFVWRTFYKFEEVDDMCYLVLFGLTGILRDIYYKKSLWPILAWTLLTILIRMGWIWWQQWIIYSLGNSARDDVIHQRIVSLQCSNFSMADSGHIYVAVGDDQTFEIFKKDGKFTAVPVKQKPELRKRRNVRKSRFYIPLIQYGVMGATNWSDIHLSCLYEEEFKRMEEEYSPSYKSCQEFAFLLIDRMCLAPARFNIRMTLFKSLMTAIALFIVPLLIILYYRIDIQYKP